ncbi:hypothetical protein M407DRAFT_102021 [Tulasnella calospora MUT 4182]|uniref:Uncharacterized protein n=1 Tax=Tulasnella calospora MUT 4182 TaxID=1051891 RepID=A0A0C3Q5B5_9AGAM|nr:hypothetical protein M407DRAFT_102021 [Tulasnella calospora MUT 4182]
MINCDDGEWRIYDAEWLRKMLPALKEIRHGQNDGTFPPFRCTPLINLIERLLSDNVHPTL